MNATHLWKVLIDGSRHKEGPDGTSRFWVYVAGTAEDRAGAVAAALRYVTAAAPAFGESAPFTVKQSRVIEVYGTDPRNSRIVRQIGALVRFEIWLANI